MKPERLHVMHVHRVLNVEESLSKQVEDWWRTESFGTKYEDVTLRSREAKRAREILERTVKHVCDRYEVGMLWREREVKFPDSRLMAEKRLESTQRKLKRGEELAKKYCAIIVVISCTTKECNGTSIPRLRLVQSAKRVLKVVVEKQCVNDETLLTFMVEVASLMNGRPLTCVSTDYRDEEALTPNHFLLRRGNPNFPAKCRQRQGLVQPQEVKAHTSYDPALLETLAPGIPTSVDGTPKVEDGCSYCL